MKSQFKLSIDRPCAEKFENFTSTSLGGFCQSCQKEVIDFTKMTDDEIVRHFKNVKGKSCGRFKQDQLTTYTKYSQARSNNSFKWAGVGALGLSLLLPVNESFSQGRNDQNKVFVDSKVNQNIEFSNSKDKHYVKGTVFYRDDKEPLPGVNVVVKGTTIGTVTDMDGKFEFKEPLNTGDVLVFSFIGLVTEEVKISNKLSFNVDLGMIEMEADFMGEVAINEVYSSKVSFWQKVKGLFK